jgi:hypothetical protein
MGQPHFIKTINLQHLCYAGTFGFLQGLYPKFWTAGIVECHHVSHIRAGTNCNLVIFNIPSLFKRLAFFAFGLYTSFHLPLLLQDISILLGP